jgi:hypothetical protein
MPLPADAHGDVTAGPYMINYGWVAEPPLAGTPNAIELSIGAAPADGHAAQAEDPAPVAVDAADLRLEIAYGGEGHVLALQPHAGDEPGQFTASFTPAYPGRYTLTFSGALRGELGPAQVDAQVHLQEVVPDTQAAPRQESSGMLLNWAIAGGAVLGAAGLAIAVALQIRRRR